MRAIYFYYRFNGKEFMQEEVSREAVGWMCMGFYFGTIVPEDTEIIIREWVNGQK